MSWRKGGEWGRNSWNVWLSRKQIFLPVPGQKPGQWQWPGREQEAMVIESSIEGELDTPLVACTCGWYAGPVSSATEILNVKRTPDGWVDVETVRKIIS